MVIIKAAEIVYVVMHMYMYSMFIVIVILRLYQGCIQFTVTREEHAKRPIETVQFSGCDLDTSQVWMISSAPVQGIMSLSMHHLPQFVAPWFPRSM